MLAAAAHATKAGLKFPDINLEDLSEPKEFLAFEGDETGTPTVLWFTLCNRNFKKLKNYKPRFSSGKSKKLTTEFTVCKLKTIRLINLSSPKVLVNSATIA